VTSGVGFDPTPLELATGLVFGRDTDASPPAAEPLSPPIAAIERVVLPALLRPPCLVSFSGGRDSSCVLAVAARLARREGLAPPVPATNRFPQAEGSDESEWQELVIRHLGLTDWLRLEFQDELDAVGPAARSLLERHGLLWPFNVHFHQPLLEAAAGGSLLTGIGGDEVFAVSPRRRAADVLSRRVRPVPRDVLRVGFALAPARIRAALLRRRVPLSMPWLTAQGRRLLARTWSREAAAEPAGYRQRLRWWRGSRYFGVSLRSLELVAHDSGALLVHPFAAAPVHEALAELDPDGPADRATFVEAVFGDLLPRDLYGRRTKSHFDRAFWGRHARAAAEAWSGECADPAVVDAEALRREWRSPDPDPHTLTLLQATLLERPPGDDPPPRRARTSPAGASPTTREARPA
jgi:Asparagine synthase